MHANNGKRVVYKGIPFVVETDGRRPVPGVNRLVSLQVYDSVIQLAHVFSPEVSGAIADTPPATYDEWARATWVNVRAPDTYCTLVIRGVQFDIERDAHSLFENYSAFLNPVEAMPGVPGSRSRFDLFPLLEDSGFHHLVQEAVEYEKRQRKEAQLIERSEP